MEPTPGEGPTTKVRPVQEIRLGAVKAAIWRNETESGPRYNATFERLYRDGDTWKSTSSFGRDDLLVLGKVADQVHTWILTEGRDAAAGGGAAHPQHGTLTGSTLPRRAA